MQVIALGPPPAGTSELANGTLSGAFSDSIDAEPRWLLTQTMPDGQTLLEFLDGQGKSAFALRFEDAKPLWTWAGALKREILDPAAPED